MGDDRVHGPLSRFIPSIEEYLEVSHKKMKDSVEAEGVTQGAESQ